MIKTPSRNDFLLLASPRDPFEGALEAYFKATHLLLQEDNTASEAASTFEVNKIFYEAMHERLNRTYNPHLRRGLSKSLLSKPEEGKSFFYRPTLILKRLVSRSKLIEQQMYKNREKLKAARKSRSIEEDAIEVLFSPLYFMRQYLTDPEYTGSDAYAHAIIRAHIFAEALEFDRQRPRQTLNDEKDPHPFDRIREFIRFERLVRSLRKIERHWSIGDNIAPANATDFIVMHILASRGYLILRLGKKALKDRNEIRVSRDEFLKNKTLTCPQNDDENLPQGEWQPIEPNRADFEEDEDEDVTTSQRIRNRTYEFRVLPEIARLPVAAELVSEIDGLPLPVPGADVVLHRGLRFTEDSGVVARLSGRTGTGKSRHTAKFRPWRLTTYIAFSSKMKAEAFELYLKSGSGHAFAKRRLW